MDETTSIMNTVAVAPRPDHKLLRLEIQTNVEMRCTTQKNTPVGPKQKPDDSQAESDVLLEVCEVQGT